MLVREYTPMDREACLRIFESNVPTYFASSELRRIADEPSADSVRLDTSQHTRAYYEKAGFHVERVVPDGYAPGYDRYDMTLQTRPEPA